jgi:hypothetical protein
VAEWLRFDNVDDRVHDAWRTHADYQRRLFEETPVFGEEPFALADVYVDVECGTLTWEEITAEEDRPGTSGPAAAASNTHVRRAVDPFDEAVGGRHDLLTTVMSLIADADFRDAVVVQGAAGSGKSAFTLRRKAVR